MNAAEKDLLAALKVARKVLREASAQARLAIPRGERSPELQTLLSATGRARGELQEAIEDIEDDGLATPGGPDDTPWSYFNADDLAY